MADIGVEMIREMVGVEDEDAPLSAAAPEDSVLDTLYDEFMRANYKERLLICRRAIEEQLLDGERAFEFFNTLFDAATKHGDLDGFNELVALLRQHQPDIYNQEAQFFQAAEREIQNGEQL